MRINIFLHPDWHFLFLLAHALYFFSVCGFFFYFILLIDLKLLLIDKTWIYERRTREDFESYLFFLLGALGVNNSGLEFG